MELEKDSPSPQNKLTTNVSNPQEETSHSQLTRTGITSTKLETNSTGLVGQKGLNTSKSNLISSQSSKSFHNSILSYDGEDTFGDLPPAQMLVYHNRETIPNDFITNSSSSAVTQSQFITNSHRTSKDEEERLQKPNGILSLSSNTVSSQSQIQTITSKKRKLNYEVHDLTKSSDEDDFITKPSKISKKDETEAPFSEKSNPKPPVEFLETIKAIKTENNSINPSTIHKLINLGTTTYSSNSEKEAPLKSPPPSSTNNHSNLADSTTLFNTEEEKSNNSDFMEPKKTRELPKSQFNLTSCPICSLEMKHLSSDLRQQHINSCLDLHAHEEEFEREEYICDICGKNITHFNKIRRQQHMNRCCDKLEEEYSILKGKLGDMRALRYACPVCSTDLSELLLKSRINHLKQCAKKNSVTHLNVVHSPQVHLKTLLNTSPLSESGSLTPRAPVPKPPIFSKSSKFFKSNPPLVLPKPKKNSKKKKKKKSELEEELMDDDLLVGLALSKSIIEETNFFEDTFPTKPNKQNSAEQNEKIIETLFPKNSPSQFNSTPQFNESNLSKKYRNTTYGSLHKQQVTNVWKSSPPKNQPLLIENKQNETEKTTSSSLINNSPSNVDGSFVVPSTYFPATFMERKEISPLRNINSNITCKEKGNSHPPSLDFNSELKKVLSEYQTNCNKQKEILLAQLEEIQSLYYSEIGKLTLEKESKIQKLVAKYNISDNISPFLEFSFPHPFERKETTTSLKTSPLSNHRVTLDNNNNKINGNKSDLQQKYDKEFIIEEKNLSSRNNNQNSKVEEESDEIEEEEEEDDGEEKEEISPKEFNIASSLQEKRKNSFDLDTFSSPSSI